MKKLFIVLFSIFISFNFAFAQTAAYLDQQPLNNSEIQIFLDKFDERIAQVQKDWNIPGMAVCIVKDDKVIYEKVYGVRDIQSKEPVNENTIFQLGSCSKAFTAALTAILADEKYFGLDDKVIDILPNFTFSNQQLSDNITIADLLGQRTGLHEYALHYTMLFEYEKSDIINALKYVRFTGTPKINYSYQNVSYLLVGEIIAYKTGSTWEENMKKKIFKPLKMKYVSTDLESYLKNKNRTKGHYYSSSTLNVMPDELPYNSWPYNFAPAGGINASIKDMSKWLLFLIRGGFAGKKRLVSQSNFDRLFERGVEVSKGNYYDLGWRESVHGGHKIFWHGGSTDTQGAFVSFMPDEKIGIVVLMNLNNISAAQSLSLELYDSYLRLESVDWSRQNLQKAENRNKARVIAANAVLQDDKKTPMNLVKYAGIYKNPAYGEVRIILLNGILRFSAGKYKTWLVMKHFDGNDFGAYNIPGWTFKNPMFRFRTDNNSNITGLYIEQMIDVQDGFFKKIK